MNNQVWGITIAKDEADCIGFTIAHLISQGVDGIIIIDNGSTDNTVEVIEKVRWVAPIPILLRRDPVGTGYSQANRMNELAEAAAGMGMGLCIPWDSDEIWWSPRGKVANLLRKHEDFSCQYVPQFFHYSTVFDDAADPNPYSRMQYRTREPRPWQKVCFRWRKGLVIGSGNHDLLDQHGNKILQSHWLGIEIRHFPCRSFELFTKKIVRHGEGMDRAYPDDETWNSAGPHQHHLYRLYQQQGIDALHAVWVNGGCPTDSTGHCLVKDIAAYDLVRDPAPWRDWRTK